MDLLMEGLARLSVLAADLDGWMIPPAEGGAGAVPISAPIEGVQQVAVQTAEVTPGFFDQPWMIMAIWGAVIVGMYFLMFRPQRKREKAMKEMQAGLKTGDNVVTSGGLFGKIVNTGNDCFVVEMGVGGKTVRVPILKHDVLGVREPDLNAPKESVE